MSSNTLLSYLDNLNLDDVNNIKIKKLNITNDKTIDMYIIYTKIEHEMIHIITDGYYDNIHKESIGDPLDIKSLWRILKAKDFDLEDNKLEIYLPYFKFKKIITLRKYREGNIVIAYPPIRNS